MRVAALTQGYFTPATRFRVRQHIPKLQNFGIDVVEYCPEINAYAGVPFNLDRWPRLARLPMVAAWQGLKIGLRIPHVYQTRRYDVTWLQRELLPGYLTLERILKLPLVFDVDDAIWLSRTYVAERVAKIAARATTIFAGNICIAEWFSPFNNNIVVIPTAVDINRFYPLECVHRESFTVGWIGVSANLRYIEEIAPALIAFLKQHDDVVLFVVADQAPKLPIALGRQFRYLAWSEFVEAEAIQNMDVGIMPLSDNEWTRGKCSFKMLQYMACGIPVVVSPVGMNATVLGLGNIGFGASTIDEWVDALNYLYQNRTAGRQMGNKGREIVETGFSTDVVSQMIAEAFKSIGS